MEYLLLAPDTQSLMYEQNSFIQSHVFVIASILKRQPKDKSRKCSHSFNDLILSQSTHNILADKSGGSCANVIVRMTSEGSHESVFCVPQ